MQPLTRIRFVLCLMAYTVLVRLLPYFLTDYSYSSNPGAIFYPWNFVPLTGLCLLTGAWFTRRWMAYVLPLLTVFISDLSIAVVTGHLAWGFPADRWSAYLCYPLMVWIGTGLDRQSWPSRALHALGRGLFAEALFFVITNLAYFVSQQEIPHTLAGLTACLTLAIPFAGKSFASTMIFSLLLFSPLVQTERNTEETVSDLQTSTS